MFSRKSLVPYAIHTNQVYERRDYRRLGARNGNKDKNSFINNINEYLRSLNILELLESKKGLLPGYVEPLQRLLPSNGLDSKKLGSSNDLELPIQRLLLSNILDANATELP